MIRTERSGSVEEAAERRRIPLAALIKTLVVRRGDDDYLFVLVPGDRSIDWAKLRSHLDVRRLSLADATEALDVTGYERGAITPFGATEPWPVIADVTLADHPVVSIGGGGHGISVKIEPTALVTSLRATVADVTKPA